jgi:hypothetical protein
MGSTRRFGQAAAACATFTSLGYAVPQVLQVVGVLTDPWDRILIFLPSLLLAPSFVCAMAAAMDLAPAEHQGRARAAFGLAVQYATLVSIVYVIQLGVIIPRDLRGDGATVASFACCTPGMPLTAVDLLGYSLMSVATWLLSGALPREPRNRWLRWMLIANGWLVFALIGQLIEPRLIIVGAAWLVTFPAAMILLWRRLAASG